MAKASGPEFVVPAVEGRDEAPGASGKASRAEEEEEEPRTRSTIDKLFESFDASELRSLPREFLETFSMSSLLGRSRALSDKGRTYPWWTKGDTDAFFALWSDNLGTQLALLAAVSRLDRWPKSFAIDHFMPGVGISLLFGNVYYALQASKVAARTGNHTTCAQPYGINTPAAMAKTFAIILPVYLEELASTGDEMHAADLAWRVACACTFVEGLIEFLGAFFAPMLTKSIPPVILLTPLTGIALSWLFLNPLSDMVAHPIVGLVPFVIVWMAMFGDVNFGRLPAGLCSIIVGTALGWATQLNTPELVIKGAEQVGLKSWYFGACFSHLGDIGLYMNLIIPIALTGALGTLQCVCAAQQEGDNYSAMETMFVDGAGTMLGALFGSPYGTTVYIGHPAFKQMGATRGYSLLNGFSYAVISALGLHAVLAACIPHEAVLGVICFIGLSIAAHTVKLCPKRWYPAFFAGAVIGFADWSISTLAPEKGGVNSPLGFLKEGGLFISFLYTWGFSALTDRRFALSAYVWALAAALASVGIIHATAINGWDSTGTIKGTGGKDGMPGWRFTTAYGGMAVVCLFSWFLQRRGLIQGSCTSGLAREDSPAASGAQPEVAALPRLNPAACRYANAKSGELTHV
eukprot:TRINITY_DN2206_c0_g2_i10.p1 TRINITY_DN2206_c0_g2~~TRINITY_DN2206_c0_g2_i10.p1  ORF type:complete len:633 (-),score=74.48 TRINITY_DN2206_c0_g2_i10:470-2368(-)